MNGLFFIGLLGLLVGCGASESASVKPGSQTAGVARSDQPNIVILFADDLGYGDLGSYGHPYIRTPNLDTMAAEGQRWTDFYVAAPVCSPSRGALLTGKLPVRTGIYGSAIRVYFPNDPGGMPDAEITLAESLQAVGYRTGMFGKWHLGDAKHAWPTRHGFDQWLGLPYSNDMDGEGELTIDELIALSQAGKNAELGAALAGRGSKYAQPRQAYWNVPLFSSRVDKTDPDKPAYIDEELERPADQTELSKRYTEEAVNFISESNNEPFFLYLPYTMPHTPLFRSGDFVDASLGGRYGDVVQEIDWSVGQIRQALEASGQADNTLVIFTSDNGPWLTMKTEGGLAGLLRMGKGTTFEGGVRVPTIMWWPEQLAVGTVSELGSTLDIFRTVAKLAGADGSSGVDGFDLTSVLRDGERSPRDEMPYYRGGELFAYRKGLWKLVFISEGAYGQPPQRTVHETPQLYHLGRDPAERFDVSDQYAGVVARIQKSVQRHQEGLQIQPPLMDRRLITATN